MVTCCQSWQRVIGRKCTATCCQPWQKSREIGETRYQAWYLSWVETRTCWTSIIECTTNGLRLSRHEATEVYLTGELRHAENQSNVCCFRKLLRVSQKFETKSLRSDFFCPGEPHQRSPNAPKFEDRSQEETEGKSKMPAKQRGSWPKMCKH